MNTNKPNPIEVSLAVVLALVMLVMLGGLYIYVQADTYAHVELGQRLIGGAAASFFVVLIGGAFASRMK